MTTKTTVTKVGLTEMVATLKAQNLQKVDIILPTSKIVANQKGLIIKALEVENVKKDVEFELTGVAHQQVATKLQIPAKYYNRMYNEAPQLWEESVNTWLDKKSGDNHMVRSFMGDTGNVMRALLSDRFYRLDNYDILLTALQAIQSKGIKTTVETCDISEKRMYVRILCPEIIEQAPELLRNYSVPGVGKLGQHGICSGFIITNSEVGHGSFSVTPRLMVLACTNGMIRTKEAKKRTHLGAKMEEGVQWSQQTQKKNMELIQCQVRDFVDEFMTKDYLKSVIADIGKEAGYKVNNAPQVIKGACKALTISEEKENDILNYFIAGSDTSAFGVVQAFTFYAHAAATPDERFEIEKNSFELLPQIKNFDLNPSLN